MKKICCILVLFGAIFLIAENDIVVDDPQTVTTAARCIYQEQGDLPDRNCTPGSRNPKVTQKTIGKTICVKGWTRTVRPSTGKTRQMKIISMEEYGVKTDDVDNYEYDHLIPLELGGASLDRRNLWPQRHPASFDKDGVENTLRHRVCSGTMTLARARVIMETDWRLGR